MIKWAGDRLGDPVLLRAVHGYGSWFWVIMAIPSMIWWKNSVPYLVGISVYAVAIGHWSAWQASRVEDQQQAALRELREVVGQMQDAVNGLREAGRQISKDS